MIQTFDIPYVPTTPEKLSLVLEFADIQPGQKTADLGAGDGRIVIACAKLGAEAHGYEMNSDLITQAIEHIREEGLSDTAFIHQQNFWDVDLSPFHVVTIYGITTMMKRLEEKLTRELHPGTRIISNRFRFPNWEPIKKRNNVYLYRANDTIRS